MECAIILCFDKNTEASFKSIIGSVAASGVSSHMVDAGIPPHITIAGFSTDRIEAIIERLDARISCFKAGTILWPSLGVFVPRVLFAAPVLDEYLLHACIDANRLIEPFSTVGDNGFYLPYHWVPHTTLATHLDHDGLKQAFAVASRQFTFISGKSNRLVLVDCSPCHTRYREIRTWEVSP